jgi:Rv2525c-like, glycoside hydrolase-like domain/D-alanyl-D-alanine carboxypeptidase
VTSPADLGWGDPRALTSADMTGAQLWPGHVVQVRNDDVAVVAMALVRRLRAAGWNGPDPLLDEWGYTRRLKRWAEAKYRAQGLTEAQWLQTAPLTEWSDHAWGTAIDLDTAANPMLATRPADPQAHTTLPVAACPGIAAGLGLAWGGSWTEPWDPQHFQVAVTPQRLAQIAAPVRRAMEVLDYSSGYPTPSSVKMAGYAGVVRYIGTPGRGKNLTRAEAQAMHAAGIPIALVYEDSAGWMNGGAAAGVAAARAALADAGNCGVTVRCVYFACDVDVTSQMGTVMACLDGAATVLGKARTGVYGEADVVDAAVPGHAAWGWQTRAWSGGRLSARAAMLQQIGYVSVGGVQCDRNTVLKDDWGQWPYLDGGDLTMADAASLEKQITGLNTALTALSKKLDDLNRLWTVGDAPDSAKNPDGTPVDKGGHPWNLEAVRNILSVQGQTLNALAAKLNTLSTTATDPVALASALAPMLPHVDQQAVEAALREVLGSVDNAPPAAG